MSKVRIAFVITGLHGGGAETMLYRLLNALNRERFEPTVISLIDDGRLGNAIKTLDVPVKTAGLTTRRPNPAALIRLVKLIRASRPDVIQGWMYHGNLAAQLAGIFARAPVCWCIQHSFSTFADEKPLTRLTIRVSVPFSRLAARIVYVSHASRGQHQGLGFLAKRGFVIPNGVDPALFQPSAEARQGVRAELGVPADALLIGLIARYHPQKDHATFLEAAAALARDWPGVHFVLAGAQIDPGNAALSKLVDRLELGARVHFLGERTDLPRLTAALDVATSSSCFGEALSLAITEAMACAVPCVVTDVGDSAQLVGQTGVIVPPRDPKALAGGWLRLLAEGEAGRRKLGAAARRRIEEHYSVRGIARVYEELYLGLN